MLTNNFTGSFNARNKFGVNTSTSSPCSRNISVICTIALFLVSQFSLSVLMIRAHICSTFDSKLSISKYTSVIYLECMKLNKNIFDHTTLQQQSTLLKVPNTILGSSQFVNFIVIILFLLIILINSLPAFSSVGHSFSSVRLPATQLEHLLYTLQ